MDSESSSGNDEEFDSSKNETDNNIVSSLLNHSPHYPFLTQQNPTFFDPQNTHNHLDQPLVPQSNPNYGNNNDLIWSRGSSSNQPNYANFENLTPQQAPYSSPSSTTHRNRPSVPSDQLSNVIKNPKKRTRASRRAPTTVLTTDPTNFRQMVQEFTGIPASPFSGSPFSRRPDIFSGLRPNPHLDTLGPLYPLRQAANKIFTSFSSPPPPPPLLNSSIGPTTSVVATTSSNLNNYQLPFEHLLNLNQHQNIDTLQMSGFPSQEDGNNDENAREIRWRSGEIVRNNDGVRENNMVTFDGNRDMHVSGSSSYNLNISEKDMENVVASSGHQGNVASWICPSD